MVDDKELVDLVEAEVRELLNKYGFPGTQHLSLKDQVLKAYGAKSVEDEWAKPVLELIKTLDEYIPEPVRAVDQPFLMPIEPSFSIEGRLFPFF